jgi:hypothetical protein
MLPYHPAEPQIQHVVQVDVRQQWREDGALRRSFLRCPDQAILQNAAFEHPSDQTNDPLITDPVA